MLRVILLGLLLVSLLLTPARAQTPTDIPAATIDNPKAFWRAAMEAFYGSYDKRRRCWVGRIGTEQLCMRPHLLSVVTEKGAPSLYVAMAGYAIAPDGSRADCHACPGKLGLAVLRRSGDRLALVARNNLAADAGSWGRTPPEEAFRVVRLGADNHGWLMEFLYTAQGYTEGGTAVFGVLDGKVSELGFIPTHSDNTGTCGDGIGACFVHSYELRSGPAGASSRFGDLIAQLVESSNPEAPVCFRIPFAPADGRYLAPAGMEAALGQ